MSTPESLVPAREVERLWILIDRMAALLQRGDFSNGITDESGSIDEGDVYAAEDFEVIRAEQDSASAIGRPGFTVGEMARLHSMVFTVLDAQKQMGIPMAGAADLRPLLVKLEVHGRLLEHEDRIAGLSQ